MNYSEIEKIINNEQITEIIPRKYITIEVAEISVANEIRLYLEYEWQSAVLRKTIYDFPTPCFPATFIKEQGNTNITLSKNVLKNTYSK